MLRIERSCFPPRNPEETSVPLVNIFEKRALVGRDLAGIFPRDAAREWSQRSGGVMPIGQWPSSSSASSLADRRRPGIDIRCRRRPAVRATSAALVPAWFSPPAKQPRPARLSSGWFHGRAVPWSDLVPVIEFLAQLLDAAEDTRGIHHAPKRIVLRRPSRVATRVRIGRSLT